MVIVSGWLRVDPLVRDAYVTGCRKVVIAARTAPGCQEFVIAADLLEDDRVIVYERWASDAELAEFRGSGPDPDQSAAILEAQVQQYRVAAVESA
ncbi:putative quinol monooxygenase [Streptomyces sp. NBC_00690]|uniref:putative quinol monooxygenase n=1 Tax=Streptomyces sp. NBC_00690 TaxID=2975808 RepID=UPI002E2904FF|nr:antibiotic biosynthesis monooxygenase family protein [Streptomyces sp. NBC_00690]